MSNGDEELQKKLTLLSENWNHSRHVENERLHFAQIYGAIVAGVLAIISFAPSETQTLGIGSLYLIGVLGFVLTIKLTFAFMNYINKISELVETDDTLREHMGMPLSGGIFNFIKVRYIFLIFYMALCSFLLYLVIEPFWIILQLGLMLVAIIIANEEFNKKLKIKKIVTKTTKKDHAILKSSSYWEIKSYYDDKIGKPEVIKKIRKLDDSQTIKELERKSIRKLNKIYKKALNEKAENYLL